MYIGTNKGTGLDAFSQDNPVSPVFEPKAGDVSVFSVYFQS